MVLLMYWEDDTEERRKILREEKLRAKKGFSSPVIPATIEASPGAVSVEIPESIPQDIAKQAQAVEDLNKKLDTLSKTLEQQQALLKSIATNGNQHPVIPEPEDTNGFIKLGDTDVKVIDTIGIETVGEAGVVSEGESIMSRIAKLKKMKKDKGE